MLKEIYEQPRAIRETLADSRAQELAQDISKTNRLVIVAAGTSYHAGMAFKYCTDLPVEVILSSEFPALYRAGDVLAISQSGETADTLKAVKHAKERGASVSALVNVVGSTLTREAERTLYTHAGLEIGVAATKTFISQMAALYAMDKALKDEPLEDLDIEPALELNKNMKELARKIKNEKNIFYLGRGPSYVTAMEGALKMKELSYLHAEAYPGGELKHGPLALIEAGVPVVAVCPDDAFRDKMMGNLEEVKSRGAFLVVFGTEGDHELERLADRFYPLPKTEGLETSIFYTVPLQLLSYHTAVALGKDPDKPRNLAKSVTVE